MSRTMPPRVKPPRVSAWLARRAVRHRAWRETALGDLQEEFDARLDGRTGRDARRWYRREAAHLASERLADAGADAGRTIHTLLMPSGDRPMQALLRDVVLSIRSLRRRPLVTTVIVGTLALGLGANAATYGMIDRLLLRPFTFDGVDRLIVVSEESPADPFRSASATPGNFMEWREQTRAVDPLAAYAWWDVNLAGGDRPERVQGQRVTRGFFETLGIEPALGRLLTDDDDVMGRHQRVVLSHGLWDLRFGADPAIVGRTIRLDGDPYEVVGVAEPGFDFPNATALWAPLALDQENAEDRSSLFLTVVGRLRDGATEESARAELSTVFARQRDAHANAIRDRRLGVTSFTAGLVDRGMPRILVLWQAAALLVLVIGCVNVANLLLARGAERQRELAVRLAIGAGRAHLVRQLLIESLVLALVAVPGALAVAWASFRVLQAAMPATLVRFLPGWDQMGVGLDTVAFTTLAAFATSAVFGLLPALRSSRPSLTGSLRDGGRGTTGGRSRLRRGLVVAQVALALPLLVLSGLSVVGVQRFANGPQGFNPDGVIKARTRLPLAGYPDADSRRQFQERLLQTAQGMPGARMVATSSVLPSTASGSSRDVVVEGVPPAEGMIPAANFRAVSAGYLELMEIPLLEGRYLEAGDREDTEAVTVVSASFARRFLPDASAVGRRVAFSREPDAPLFRVVGVVGDTIDDWFAGSGVPTAYVPAALAPATSVYLVARTDGDPTALADAMRATIVGTDPDQAAYEVSTMREAIFERTTGLRFVAGLMAVFGLLALVLAAFGIYGVMAHHVEQRRHEIGVRMALGASGARVLRETLRQGVGLAAVGLAIGLVVGIGLARLMESALFGIVALEPALFAGITGALALVALAATLVPAATATRVDPMTALRNE